MMSEFEKQVRHALIDRDMTMTDLDSDLDTLPYHIYYPKTLA